MTPLIAMIIVVAGSIGGAYAGILLKKGSNQLKPSLPALATNKNLILGIIIYAAGTLTYIYALKGAELSLLYPMASTTYIWIAILSQRTLGEKMSTYKWLGIALILSGVTLIGLGIAH